MKHCRWIISPAAILICLSGSVAFNLPHPPRAQRGALPREQGAVDFAHARAMDFITTMSERLGIAALLIDQDVLHGFVTVHKDAPVSQQEMLDIFIAGLHDNGAVLVKSGKVYQILPLSRRLGEGEEAITSVTVLSPSPSSPSRGRSVQMKFNGVSIAQFWAIIADMFAVTPLVISPVFKGSVYLFSTGAITSEEVYAIWLTVLKNSNARLIESSGRYRIVPVSQVIDPGWKVISDPLPPADAAGIPRHRRAVKPEELESHVIHRVDPIPPQLAGQSSLTNRITIDIALNEQGELELLYVARPTNPALDEAAIEAVRQWRFKPFMGPEGLPQPIEGQVTLVFR